MAYSLRLVDKRWRIMRPDATSTPFSDPDKTGVDWLCRLLNDRPRLARELSWNAGPGGIRDGVDQAFVKAVREEMECGA
jgi:hypothetical protein